MERTSAKGVQGRGSYRMGDGMTPFITKPRKPKRSLFWPTFGLCLIAGAGTLVATIHYAPTLSWGPTAAHAGPAGRLDHSPALAPLTPGAFDASKVPDIAAALQKQPKIRKRQTTAPQVDPNGNPLQN